MPSPRNTNRILKLKTSKSVLGKRKSPKPRKRK